MKTKSIILSLAAIFMSVTFLTAQTTTAQSKKTKAKTEVKCEKKMDAKECSKDAKTEA